MIKKLTPRESRNGYIKDFSFNPDWKKHNAICGYEHCIELMPVEDCSLGKSCPIFGHNCPGGKEAVDRCQISHEDVPQTRFVKEEEKKVENKEKIQPELKDIMEAIDRYVAVNNGKVTFIASFIAIDEEKMKRDERDIFKDGADRIFIYGPKETLRVDLEGLRNMIEDEADEDGFVNI